MNNLQIKDAILLIVANTFHTEVTLEYLLSGDHMYRFQFKKVPDDDLASAVNEMLADGHLELRDGAYWFTDVSREIFSDGGYETCAARAKRAP